MKKIIPYILTVTMLTVVLTGCGGDVTYKDGTYTGQSEVHESEDGTDNGNGYGVVTITIKDGAISECE